MYALVKYVHVVSVTLSIAGFFVQGALAIRSSPLLTARWMAVLPHVNDTILLVAALSLVAMSGEYPFVVPWLTAKVLGVVAYIVLGVLALQSGRSQPVRVICWLSAMVVAGWIVSVVVSKHPGGFLAGWFQIAG